MSVERWLVVAIISADGRAAMPIQRRALRRPIGAAASRASTATEAGAAAVASNRSVQRAASRTKRA